VDNRAVDYECDYCGMVWKEKAVMNAYGKTLKGTCPRCEERAPYSRISEQPSESKAGDRPDA
jgi:hypothetical protein